jgi:integrase
MHFNQNLLGIELIQGDTLMLKDVWNASELGTEVNKSTNARKITFSKIKQDWLKFYAKKFIKYMANRQKFSTLSSHITWFNSLSQFLMKQYPYVSIDGITRLLIVDYLSCSHFKKLGIQAKRQQLSGLKLFFATGVQNDWFSVPPYLIRHEDYPRKNKPLPRYIPEEVMQQLDLHLEALPEPLMRMTLVLKECGLRYSELSQLPLNCLKQDAQGNWSIQFMRWKMHKESIVPISYELALIIKKQQEYIKNHLEDNYSYLFCGRKGGNNSKTFVPKPDVMRQEAFNLAIQKLAEEFDICDSSGKRWHFQSHQFRHTVGTHMINSGVPQHIIQKYLGHESPEMTMRYAHIHDETLRKEIEKYHESKVVNFQGKTAELEETVLANSDDLEWFKKTVQARALEHGYCARPKLLGDCDIPGFDGCYNCPHWRTNKNFLPVLKDTLQRTENVLNKARNCGWELQVKKNEPVKTNLEKVIKSLEEAS